MNNKVLNKDALKAWILSKMVTLTNNLLATTPGVSAMDAAQGPVIQGQIDKINSNFVYDDNGIYGYRRRVDGADTVFPFSSYNNVLYKATAYANTHSVSLTVPENIDKGIVIYEVSAYTSGAESGTIQKPDGIEYDVIFDKTLITPEGGTGTNQFSLEVISCKNISNKTFTISGIRAHVGGKIVLLY